MNSMSEMVGPGEEQRMIHPITLALHCLEQLLWIALNKSISQELTQTIKISALQEEGKNPGCLHTLHWLMGWLHRFVNLFPMSLCQAADPVPRWG